MSMNLKCKQMELWQTPTYITYMCYSNRDGGWNGIKYRYKLWVESRATGRWNCDEDYYEMCKNIKEHLEELDSFKRLTFYVQ